jgi:hypothetical protein
MKRVRKTAVKMINRVMAMIGIKIANILTPTAPKISRKEKTGLARPPVAVEDSPRRATVVA